MAEWRSRSHPGEPNHVRRPDRRASVAAAEAFIVRDFGRVVKLLAPFEAVLTAAERKKLLYARRHSKS